MTEDNAIVFPVNLAIKIVDSLNLASEEIESLWSFDIDDHNGLATIDCYCDGYYQGEVSLPPITNFGDGHGSLSDELEKN